MKFIYFLIEVYVYIPFVSIPPLIYSITDDYIWPSLFFFILVTIKYVLAKNIRNLKVFIFIELFILLICLLNRSQVITEIYLIIMNGFLNMILRTAKYKIYQISKIRMLIGMLIIGCLLQIRCILDIILWLIFFVFLSAIFFTSGEVQLEREKVDYSDIFQYKKQVIIFAIAHNLQYYCFAFILPIIPYIYGWPQLSGFLVAISWLLFLLKDKLNDFVITKMSQYNAVTISFGILSILYFFILFRDKGICLGEVIMLMLLQGSISGIAEEFGRIQDLNEKVLYRVWEFAGLVGSIISIFISLIVSTWTAYFILPAFITGGVFAFSIGDCVWKK